MTAATNLRNTHRFVGGAYVANLMAELSRVAITQRIQRAREESGLKQHELAEAMSVHPRTVQNWESEATPIVPWDRLDELAGLLGVTKQWLIHGDAEESSDELTEVLGGVRLLQQTADNVLDALDSIQTRLDAL